MNLNRLFRTTSFRLAVLYAALFSASTGLLFAFVYWTASGALYGQARSALESEFASVQAGGRDQASLAREVSRRSEIQRGRILYLLEESSGRRIAGTLNAMPAFDGWREFSSPEDAGGDDSEANMLVLGKVLPGGDFLAVATSTGRIQDAEEAMVNAFSWATGGVLVLALAGGIGLSRRFLRRIDNMNRTTRAIMQGDIARRISTRSTGDELDQLAANLNEMLDRLQHVMEGLRQVSADIAHELRTPLGRLKLRLDTAITEAHSPEEYRNAIHQASLEAGAALSTFSALLRIAQIESGTRRASFADVDLSAVVQNLTGAYGPVADDLGKRLTSRVAPGIHLPGDGELLTQMLVNLIENALRHTPAGTVVNLELIAGNSGPVLTISDNGPGIPEAEREKVFNRFHRLEASRSTPGSGLGLALVAAVAELHSAHIVLSDNCPGLKVTIRFDPPMWDQNRTKIAARSCALNGYSLGPPVC